MTAIPSLGVPSCCLSARWANPLPGCKVNVLIESERRIHDVVTDVEGKNAVALPEGHAQAWGFNRRRGFAREIEEALTPKLK
jgi:hypothetical protein